MTQELNILIADDDAVNLMIIERVLVSGIKKFNFDFECKIFKVENGLEIFDILKNEEIDLILLDWEMPGMDGIDVLKKMKSDEDTLDIPVIMITGNTTSEHLRLALETGAIDFLRKPVDAVELIARLSSVVKVNAAYQQVIQSNKKVVAHQAEIKSSITYAARLQNAMLPSADLMTKLFYDNFIINMPRDIVSGDFYWVKKVNGLIFIVLGDCTGHGVPGAMMSMLGHHLLNEAILNAELTAPEQILAYLHKGVRQSLHQTYSTVIRDGMDMGIVVINPQSHELSFAGAMHHLYIHNLEEWVEIKGDKLSIGGKQLEEERIFQSVTMPYKSGYKLLLHSDGYVDQFGGEDFKKFLAKRFMDLLNENGEKSSSGLGSVLQQTINNWMKGYEQMDDILVLGVTLK